MELVLHKLYKSLEYKGLRKTEPDFPENGLPFAGLRSIPTEIVGQHAERVTSHEEIRGLL